MTVAELIKRLKACNPDAEVHFAWASDNTCIGDPITEVVQITYFDGDDEPPLNDVLLRG